MDADLDTLATALYVTTDDFLIANPQHRPWRPKVGITPRLSDAELVTLAVMQALLGFTREASWLRYAHSRLRGLFPYLPHNRATTSGCATAATMLRAVIAHLAPCTSSVHRRRVGGRLDAGRVRPLAGDRETLRPGRVGRVRLLRLALPLLLGPAAAPGVHPARAAGRLGADRRQGRRTRNPARDARRRPRPARHPARPDADRPTRTTTAASSKPRWPTPASSCCALPARARDPVRDNASSSHCGRSSSRSTTPSRANSTSNTTAAAPSPASAPASCNASSPSPPRSGTTTDTGQPILRSLTAYDH